MTRLARAADAALLVLAAVLPFETTNAVFSLAGFRVTSVEIVLFVALLLGAAALAVDRPRARRVADALPRTWLALLGAFALAAFVSALAAPAFEHVALRAAARTAIGLALIPLAVASLTTRRDLARLAAAVGAGALASAALGVADISSSNPLAWLTTFRPHPTYQGTIQRLSGPFDHSNIAAMFFEAAVPLLMGLAWVAWRAGRRLAAGAGVVAAAFVVEALLLTYSRGGIAGLLVSNGLVALLVVLGKPDLRQRAVPAAAVAGLGLVLLLTTLGASSTTRVALRRASPQDPLGLVSRGAYAGESAAHAPIPRRKLWRAAIHLVRERPVTGYGLDTFRLTYGPELGLRTWDRSQHSNSLYVETLVSLGVVGAGFFFAWLLVLVVDIGRTLLRRADVWRAATAAALLAYIVHGVVDYFLLFSATGLLFWLLCGGWLAARRVAT